MNIAIIPARGGSKRIPRKNIKEFCGKPMIAYAITAAVFSNLNKFRNMHPALRYLNPEEMASDSLSAPLHDGAKRYFKENGLLR